MVLGSALGIINVEKSRSGLKFREPALSINSKVPITSHITSLQIVSYLAMCNKWVGKVSCNWFRTYWLTTKDRFSYTVLLLVVLTAWFYCNSAHQPIQLFRYNGIWNSINERAPFPRVYTSLVSALRVNEHWRLCYISAFRGLQSTFLWRPPKAVENSFLTFLDLFKLFFKL